MGLVVKDDSWRVSDVLWAKMEPLLPPRPESPAPIGATLTFLRAGLIGRSTARGAVGRG